MPLPFAVSLSADVPADCDVVAKDCAVAVGMSVYSSELPDNGVPDTPLSFDALLFIGVGNLGPRNWLLVAECGGDGRAGAFRTRCCCGEEGALGEADCGGEGPSLCDRCDDKEPIDWLFAISLFAMEGRGGTAGRKFVPPTVLFDPANLERVDERCAEDAL